jgi:Uma2 family endonuclease
LGILTKVLAQKNDYLAIWPNRSIPGGGFAPRRWPSCMIVGCQSMVLRGQTDLGQNCCIFVTKLLIDMEPVAPALSEYETQRGKPMPSKNHAVLQTRLVVCLCKHYAEKYEILSEISLELSDWEATPDLAIFPKMQIDFLEDEVRLTEPPLCVIEILSPTQALNDLTAKANKYFRNGVKSCWLVLPTFKNIYVFSNIHDYRIFSAQDTLIDATLDLQIPLAEVFK